eukprot:CAMPEP_0194354490 /NCGR_PEP_ID=MMETSP0174-20130528/2647_1 /TAXON_ID=216777 /ORGANISM="Proboscia alata, Strain PI-D3" /LENGTH=464 /DNA_ID=CAMNT_0039123463 /DNA_START=161 /DNA_END=1555 /DNA_ORIENTATION=-
MTQSNLFYDFGSWGHYTPSMRKKVMPGFLPSPPGTEICGEYDIVFAAALDDSNHSSGGCTKIFLRMTTQGRLTIQECSNSLPVSIREDGSTEQRKIRAKSIISAKIQMPEWGHPTWNFFGPGYKVFGFPEDSKLTRCSLEKPTNASLIVTKKNNNLGRMYVVSERKAFRRIQSEAGSMTDKPVTMSKVQKQEVIDAELCCGRRHFSFLCKDLGLPCETGGLITRFVVDDPPFIFAEPGDIWIDTRLSTPTTTYVLARRRSKNFLMRPMTIHEIERYAQNMKNEFMQKGDEEKLLLSMDRMKTTPGAGVLFVQLCVKYSTGHRCKDAEREAIISILSILYTNKKLTSGDIRGGFSCFFTNYAFYIRSGREPRAKDHICNMIPEFLHLKAMDIKLFCGFLDLPDENLLSNLCKPQLIEICLVSVILRYNIAEAEKHFAPASDILVNLLGARTWYEIAARHGLRRYQ